jgi:HAD superfamily hydrolase (TIGR01509 family)
MSRASRPGVLFDLDGTLVDSNYLQTLAWSRAFSDVGEWAPMNAIHRLIGMGGDQLVPSLLGHENKEANARRPVRYKELIGEVGAFPGAAELLRHLSALGVAVVIATSAPADELEIALDVLDASAAIEATTSADDVSSSKPDPEIFNRAIEAASLDRERTLAVGDSVWDIKAATAAGIGCVAVESGGFSHYELEAAGALAVYRDVALLGEKLETSPIAALLD